MSEKSVIEKTKSPVTIEGIKRDLRRLGISEGQVLVVHSSLSSMGWVCGGAQVVIEALLEVLGDEGTLVMPAHSGDWTDPANWSNPPVPKEWIPVIRENMPAFNRCTTPTRGMGRIAETFRNHPGTLRSDHPVVSFCANGKHSEYITKEHPLEDHFGMKSPLGKLYNLGAKILLLGVTYDNCTAFHLGETMVEGFPLGEKSGTSMLVDGKRKWVEFRTIDYCSDDFSKIGDEFEKDYQVIKGSIGNAGSVLFDFKTGVDFAAEWIRNNRSIKKS
ncbi:MAG TPA: AAC(3) family N-acetyltransferase [Clostridia bacterium]|nr:AAC(3) family N-acetyltransferase [Clostridia bacterium]